MGIKPLNFSMHKQEDEQSQQMKEFLEQEICIVCSKEFDVEDGLLIEGVCPDCE